MPSPSPAPKRPSEPDRVDQAQELMRAAESMQRIARLILNDEPYTSRRLKRLAEEAVEHATTLALFVEVKS